MKLLGMVVFSVLLGLNHVQAATISFSWDKNAEKDIAGYELHLGHVTGVYTEVIDFHLGTDVSDSTGTVPTLRAKSSVEVVPVGCGNNKDVYAALLAYDLAGNKSVLSEEVSVLSVVDLNPCPPEGLDAKTLRQILSQIRVESVLILPAEIP